MVIKINAYGNYNIKNRNYNNLSFKAGKIELFSDFDNTYLPSSHAGIKCMSPNTHPAFTQYCDKFRNFLNNTRKGLKFHITTGRTFGEYQTISELIKDRGFELPLPDTFIAKNGSDEYIKIGTDEDFYKRGIFPFRYDKTNLEKEKRLKELTGWDGPKIKEKLKEILKEHNFRIVEGDSEHGIGDYGSRSLFSSGKLTYENGRIFDGADKPEWVAGLRNDGNCKIFVTYPPDMLQTPERSDILEKINEKMAEYNKSIGATKLAGYMPKQRDNECGGRICEIVEPRPFDLKDKVPKRSMLGLTKLFDTKEAVEKAIKNNDLVIVAGDSSNDFTMLNPFYYIDTPPEVYEDNVKDGILACWDVNLKKPQNIISKLDEKNPIHQRIAKQIDDLPLMGVVVKSEKDKLANITSAFDSRGSRFRKIVVVQKGGLEDGIKEAVKIYCEEHPEYAKELSPDLKKEIFGTTGDISEFLTAKSTSFSPKSNQLDNKGKFLERIKQEINDFKNEIKALKKEVENYKKDVKDFAKNGSQEKIDSINDGAFKHRVRKKQDMSLDELKQFHKSKIKSRLKDLKNKPLTKKIAIAAIVVGVISAIIFGIKKIKLNKKQIQKPINTVPLKVNTPKCFEEISKL